MVKFNNKVCFNFVLSLKDGRTRKISWKPLFLYQQFQKWYIIFIGYNGVLRVKTLKINKA